MQTQNYIGLAVSAAIGAIPFGWIIAKLWGIEDLRKVGSSNVGATNVVRTAGILPGAITFALDAAKGVGPILYFHNNDIPVIWFGFAAVLGHCFSPFLKFRGGKGVSTTLGATTAFSPWLGSASILVYLVGLATTRISALGSLFSMLTLATGTVIFLDSTGEKIAIGLIIFVVLARHRDNWNKLLTMGVAALGLVALLGASSPLRDFRGNTIDEAAKPQRVVALMPAIAESVVALGFGEKLVGATDFSKLPPDLKNIVNIGPYTRPSIEAIYGTKPDLVVASMDGNDLSVVEQLERLKLRVVTLNSRSIDDILRSMTLLAAALGNPANEQVKKLRLALSRPNPKSAKPKTVFIQVGWEPIVTVNKNTFINEIVEIAGGKNVFADASLKYPRPNSEEVISRNPDILIICDLTGDGKQAALARNYWSRFTRLSAVKQGNVYVIPGDWIAKPNLSLLKGLAELKKIL